MSGPVGNLSHPQTIKEVHKPMSKISTRFLGLSLSNSKFLGLSLSTWVWFPFLWFVREDFDFTFDEIGVSLFCSGKKFNHWKKLYRYWRFKAKTLVRYTATTYWHVFVYLSIYITYVSCSRWNNNTTIHQYKLYVLLSSNLVWTILWSISYWTKKSSWVFWLDRAVSNLIK